MKKYIAFLLALVMVLCLCACNGPVEQPVHEHTYSRGKCTGCGEGQPNYKPLEGNRWTLAGLTAGGEELDIVTMWFDGENAIVSVSYYGDLSQLDAEDREWYVSQRGDELYAFGGKQYYPLGFGSDGKLNYAEDGERVELEVKSYASGTMTLQRISGDQYKVIAETGTIIDSTIHEVIMSAGIFTCNES